LVGSIEWSLFLAVCFHDLTKRSKSIRKMAGKENFRPDVWNVLEKTKKLMNLIRLRNIKFDANCEEIAKRQCWSNRSNNSEDCIHPRTIFGRDVILYGPGYSPTESFIFQVNCSGSHHQSLPHHSPHSPHSPYSSYSSYQSHAPSLTSQQQQLAVPVVQVPSSQASHRPQISR
jgi:hypothetical protein